MGNICILRSYQTDEKSHNLEFNYCIDFVALPGIYRAVYRCIPTNYCPASRHPANARCTTPNHGNCADSSSGFTADKHPSAAHSIANTVCYSHRYSVPHRNSHIDSLGYPSQTTGSIGGNGQCANRTGYKLFRYQHLAPRSAGRHSGAKSRRHMVANSGAGWSHRLGVKLRGRGQLYPKCAGCCCSPAAATHACPRADHPAQTKVSVRANRLVRRR
jgi:hypothetical protein